MEVNRTAIITRINSPINPKIRFGILNALISHFQYSVKDINSYDELTDEEKKLISPEVFNLLTE